MLFNLLRIAVVIALPVGCLFWTAYLAGDGANLLRGKEFGALCVGQQVFRGVEQATNCLASDWLWVFRWTAWIALGVALAPVLLFLGAAILCGTSRWLNAVVFPRLIPLSITLVVLNIIVQGVLLLLAMTALWLAHIGNPPIAAMGIALVTMLGIAGGVIVGVSNVTVDPCLSAQAMKVERGAAPGLWTLVDEIADVMQAKPPDNILIGFETNFWVVSGRVMLTGYGLKGRIDGETLYMSLPLMNILSTGELVGIIGHELAHFRGRDTAYSNRFVPVFNALTSARYNLDEYDDVFERKPAVSIILTTMAKVPARALLGLLGGAFSRNVRAISRIREYEADAAATEVAEPHALARALFKIPLYDVLWEDMLTDQARRINRLHARAPRLARHFGDTARFEVTHAHAETLRKDALKARLEHPYDSHPTTRNRLKSLGLKPDAINADDLRLTDQDGVVEALIPPDMVEELEAGLAMAEYHDMQARRLIRNIPGMMTRLKVPELYQSVYALLGALVLIAPDRAARFDAAASIGEREMTDFDRMVFTEFCAERHDMPDARTAALRIVANAGPDAGSLVRSMIDELLEPEESYIKDWLYTALVP